MYKHNSNEEERQEKTRELEKKLVRELWPLLVGVKQKLDRRLVNTLLGLVIAILMHRHRTHGLLLSELGGYLLEPGYCQAGTKRISNLLHSQKWEAAMIEEYLWWRATQRVEELWGAGEWPLVIWDESVQEKPESLATEGLCAVRSSKAGRLKRIKPGYYNPPGGAPIFVPGFHWLQVLVIGRKGPPTLAHLHWWTTRGPAASQARLEEAEIFDHIDQLWGKEVIHVWDRGFAGNPWLTQAFLRGARFILRCGRKTTTCSMNRDSDSNPERFPRANAPGTTACSGMPATSANAKPVSLPFRSSILPTSSPFGWWSLGGRTSLPGISSLPNPLIPLSSPGRSSWLMPVAGRSKWPFVTISPSWLLKAPDFSNGTLATN